uniref:Uncharacterized protein n=1 Tax=Rhizophagus irregularis (strain DAOM 181602 / DAOM 197198 / MUCL 43194) TaxID=747089 RepID=U9TE81_RHIID
MLKELGMGEVEEEEENNVSDKGSLKISLKSTGIGCRDGKRRVFGGGVKINSVSRSGPEREMDEAGWLDWSTKGEFQPIKPGPLGRFVIVVVDGVIVHMLTRIRVISGLGMRMLLVTIGKRWQAVEAQLSLPHLWHNLLVFCSNFQHLLHGLEEPNAHLWYYEGSKWSNNILPIGYQNGMSVTWMAQRSLLDQSCLGSYK